MMEMLAGIAALAVPALVIGFIVLGRTRPVFLMYLAAMTIGIGYLSTTGAVSDIGREALTYLGEAKTAPSMAPKAQPSPAATPVAQPAPASGSEPAPGAAEPTAPAPASPEAPAPAQ